MNGLTAAKALRRSVEQAGGTMRISVPALGDAFGRGRMTARARAGIEHVLARAGLAVTPGLNEPGDGWVTLRATAPVVPADAAVRPRVPASLAAAAAFLLPFLLAAALVLPNDEPSPQPERAARTVDPRAQLLDRANTALLAGDYREAIALTGRADPARVPRLRAQLVAALTHQAELALYDRAYPRAIRLARRAARFGSAPGAGELVRDAQAAVARQRRRERRAAARRARERRAREARERSAQQPPAPTPPTTTAG
jgi:hypothetical protein